jgi:predicted secreted protein
MATGLVNGSDLLFKFFKNPLGYVVVGHATSCELEIVADEIDQTNKDSQGWKELILGSREWTLKCDALYENKSDPFKAYLVDVFGKIDNRANAQVEFSVNLGNAGDDNVRYRGNVKVISLNLKGDTEDQSVWNFFVVGKTRLNETEY